VSRKVHKTLPKLLLAKSLHIPCKDSPYSWEAVKHRSALQRSPIKVIFRTTTRNLVKRCSLLVFHISMKRWRHCSAAIYFLLQYGSPSGLNPVTFISVFCWERYADLAKLSFSVDWILRFKMWEHHHGPVCIYFLELCKENWKLLCFSNIENGSRRDHLLFCVFKIEDLWPKKFWEKQMHILQVIFMCFGVNLLLILDCLKQIVRNQGFPN